MELVPCVITLWRRCKNSFTAEVYVLAIGRWNDSEQEFWNLRVRGLVPESRECGKGGGWDLWGGVRYL
jgi:hypothetical protein